MVVCREPPRLLLSAKRYHVELVNNGSRTEPFIASKINNLTVTWDLLQCGGNQCSNSCSYKLK